MYHVSARWSTGLALVLMIAGLLSGLPVQAATASAGPATQSAEPASWALGAAPWVRWVESLWHLLEVGTGESTGTGETLGSGETNSALLPDPLLEPEPTPTIVPESGTQRGALIDPNGTAVPN